MGQNKNSGKEAGFKDVVGGYFELELQNGQEYHKDALRFNLGRNALKFYLEKAGIQDLYIPYYISDDLYNSIKDGNTRIHFYSIDENLQPQLDAAEIAGAHVLCINYFGICESVIKKNVAKFKNVICDYTQAFFSNPEPGIPTFYSPRNFFGVADGAYLYAEAMDNSGIEKDDSAQRYIASLVRLDGDTKAGYFLYRNTEHILSRVPVKRMSLLTQKILASIHYDEIWEIRQNNFNYLHKYLNKINRLKINTHSVHGPLIYPFLTDAPGLFNFLAENKIHLDHYWPEVILRAGTDSFETDLARNLCALPIDQRYDFDVMHKIVELIIAFLKAPITQDIQSEKTSVNVLQR